MAYKLDSISDEEARRQSHKRDEAIGIIIYAPDPVLAAERAFRAIKDFSDLEMADGDTAREIATAWLAKFGNPSR